MCTISNSEHTNMNSFGIYMTYPTLAPASPLLWGFQYWFSPDDQNQPVGAVKRNL